MGTLLRLVVSLLLCAAARGAEFRAGAAKIDITPEKFPVLVNGGFLSRTVTNVHTRLSARAICLHDGTTELVLIVVDSCMVPRPLCDAAKAGINKRTGIPAGRILIAATHTHTAPSCMAALGTEADANYLPFLRDKLVEAAAAAQKNLEPARAGFGIIAAPEHTALRRWVIRPDRMQEDPFGNRTVRANMHAAGNWDNVTGESGPEDPDLSIISIQAKNGRPIAVLGNFSMHYFSDKALSADYFGRYAEGLKRRLAPDDAPGTPPFVGMMSHGCSGDIWKRDYRKPPGQRGDDQNIQQYADDLIGFTVKALDAMTYREGLDLAMETAELRLNYRLPDAQRLAWARGIVEAMEGRPPVDRTEVYAREQILLHERKSTGIVVQALRIGDFGIATTPTETYALTGLKIKAQSPLTGTMVLDLANGGDGYIPPPEQHVLGGYNTWPARSAGLEIQAEPKIVEAALGLLEAVSDAPRRVPRPAPGNAVRAILGMEPAAYWRMEEMSGPHALDTSIHHRHGLYEQGVVFFLEGPRSGAFSQAGPVNRAAHFCGGRLRALVDELHSTYTVSLWCWNGMPDGARDIAGWLFSRERDHALGPRGEHLGLKGSGELVIQHGPGEQRAGKTRIPRWTWHHVVLSRSATRVRVYLNGALEIEWDVPADFPEDFDQVFIGGRSDNADNWEGRIDEVAVWTRALNPDHVRKLYKAAAP